MRSSWVCWWLLLAWPLLLGQPVSGEEEEFQADSSEVPETSLESEPLESAEEPEEPEDLLEQENPEEQDLEPELTSEEELEQRASFYRDRMKKNKHWGWSPLDEYKFMALDYMQSKRNYGYEDDDEDEGPNAQYMHLEDSTMTIEKAIGNVLRFQMFVKKGDCADERRWMNHDDYLDYVLSRRDQPRPSRTCQKLDCIFTVFQDVRTGRDAVIRSQCHPLVLLEDVSWHHMHRYGGRWDEDYIPDYIPNYLPDYSEDFPASNEDTPDGPDSSLPISDDDTQDEPLSGDDAPPE